MALDEAVPHNRWDLLGDPPEPQPQGRVSVVIAHYGQPMQLERTLRALGRQTHPPVEIAVGDDGSDPLPSLPDSGIPTRILTQPHLGFRAAAARNLAAQTCSGEILVFLDADTTPEPGFLAALTRRVDQSRDALVVGRRRHADLATLPVDANPSSAPQLPDPEWLSDAYATSRNLLDADGRSFRFVISAVLACRTNLFREIGGFDERFVGYGGEDWDLAYRAWNAGALLIHEPTAVAWHDGPDWSGREEDTSIPDLQTIRLASLIPEPSTRGVALPGAIPDVLVDLEEGLAEGLEEGSEEGLDVGAAVRCVHSLLRQDFRDLRLRLGPTTHPAIAELYGGQAQTEDWSADQLRRARARLCLRAPLPPSALTRAMRIVTDDDVGVVEIEIEGQSVATLTSTRAAGRAGRWADRFTADEAIATLFGVTRLDVEPAPPHRASLAGYFSLS